MPLRLAKCDSPPQTLRARLVAARGIGSRSLLALMVLVVSTTAEAQTYECAAGTQDPAVRTVVADLARIATLIGRTEQAESVVLAAIAELNESSVGVPLQYMGDSGALCPPSSHESSWCCQHNLITATNCGGGGALAVNSARCGSTRSYTRFCTEVTTGLGDYAFTGTSEHDAVALLAHELLHSIGIDHPSAVSNPSIDATVATGLSPNDQRRRSLYWYDQRCTEESMPTGRTLDGAGHELLPSGIGGEVYYGEFASFDHRDFIDYPIDGSGRLSHLVRDQGQFRYRRGSSSQPIRTIPANFAGAAPTLFYALGASQPWRIYYSRVVDGLYDYLGPNELHHAHVAYSSNEFATTVEFPLYECDNMTGFESCALFAWDPVHVAEPIAIARDLFSGRDVFVWAEQARDPFADGNLRVSIGETSAPLLVPSSSVFARTHARPAVACETYRAEGTTGIAHDCIIAYADGGSIDGRIRIKRFFATLGATHYQPVFDPGTTTVNISNAEAIGGVEAWWYDEYWYLAFTNTVPIGSPLRTQVWRSSDTLTWSPMPGGTGLGWSAQTPAAAVEGGYADSAFLGIVAP